MRSILTKAIVATTAVGSMMFATTAPAFAAKAPKPHLVPASTKVTGANPTGTTLQFNGSIDGIGVTVTCTKFSGSGKTPKSGLTVKLSKPPTFSGCTDTLGGTDTVVTSGTWSITANSTGSVLTLDVPKAGATFSSSVLSSCKITVAPSGPATITGAYDNVDTWTISGSSFPISGSGCSTSSTATATTTVKFTPAVSVES